MNAKDILTHYQNFAVIGVTTNPDKFGYKIYQRLNESGREKLRLFWTKWEFMTDKLNELKESGKNE